MNIDKDAMLDSKGAPMTQALFLETSYGNPDAVQYTLKPRDYEYKGKLLPSLKRLYMEMEDPLEYEFACEYFLDWAHWNKVKANKVIAKHMKGWDEELEVRIRSKHIGNIMQASDEGSFQAAKFLADRGWEKRGAGRPSKAEKEREDNIQDRIDSEFAADIIRING